MRPRTAFYAIAVASAICVPLTGVYPVFMMKLLCLAIFACSYNLLLGFSGMLSFGHAAFFGSAAYATGWLMTAQRCGVGVSIAGGVLAAALLGLVIGLLAIRRHGIYFAMKSDVAMYYLVLAAFVAVFLFIRRVVHSPFGQVLKAIRENEQRAISLGYEINRYKLAAFVLSASLSGLGGSLKTLVLGFATLSDVSQSASGEVILMTLLGGIGTFFGPVLGAAIVVTLQEYLSDIVGGWVPVIIGTIFVACVLAFRRGIVGELAGYGKRR
jgi:branched-chain amino acid transport system permease protein